MDKAKTRIRSIFIAACEQESAEGVQQYLDQVCGDDVQLRQEVEELLCAHHDAGEFLGGTTPNDGIGANEPSIDLCGTIIGSYKLLEVLGEGGMGTVYMAQQSQPVKRRVAVKLIKSGMDSRQVIARFEAERQALAVMDHPNIAKVLDAGTTELGQPYFVMELVKGKPITRYCDDQKLDTMTRLKLFQKVCQAVQHAHQKGIIHRDIKPSNILVAMYDDRPVPKVIDFGVAKATGDELTEKTMFTRFGQIVGTLEYMSPEQAQFNQLDIDTRSDVYSLGAVLYELLTGEPPFEHERLKSQALDETLRMIREEDPIKPSTKLHASDSAAQAALNRCTTAERLNSMIRGDLDWIVMTALEKQRSRRYSTADELAAEIDRYLGDEPVNAGPPSASYRLRKFARRNRTALAFGVTLAVAVLLGLVGMTWQAIRATNAAKQAEQQTKIAQAVEQFWNEDILMQADPFRQTMQVGQDVGLREVFDLAAKKIENRFENEPRVAAAVYKVLTTGYCNLGEFDKAIGLVNREIELRESQFDIDDPETIDARSRLGLFLKNIGQPERAVAILEAELDRCRTLLSPSDTITTETMNRLARAYLVSGLEQEAIELLEELLVIETRKHGENSQEVCLTLNYLGCAHSSLGNDMAAEQCLKKSIALANSSVDFISYCATDGNYQLGRHYMQRKRLSDAELHFGNAWRISCENYGLNHQYTKKVGLEYATCLNHLRRLAKARTVLEELFREFPDDVELEVSIGGNLCNAGILAAEDHAKESIDFGKRAIAVLDSALTREPDHARALQFRTNAQYQLGFAYSNAGEYDQSVASFKQAIDSIESRTSAEPDNPRNDMFLGQLFKYCGESYEKLGQLENAIEYYERANQLWSRLLEDHPLKTLGVAGTGLPSNPDGWMFAELLIWLTSAYMDLDRPADALRIREQRAELFPDWGKDPQNVHLTKILRGYVSAVSGNYEEATAIVDNYFQESNREIVVVWDRAAAIYALSAKAVTADSSLSESRRATLADNYGARAIECLRRALTTDDYPIPRNEMLESIRENEEFFILRDREDFQELLQKEK